MKRCRCRICVLYRQGYALVPVGRTVRLSPEGVRQRLISHGTPVRPPGGRPRFMPDDKLLRKLHAADVPKAKIIEVTGLSHQIIHRRVRELGLTFRRRGRQPQLR